MYDFMYDVITIGSATFDVFAKTESELITIKTNNIKEELIAYPSGSKILMKSLNFSIGGGGTNTAVAISRLGLKAAYLGNVGKDEHGRRIIELLKKEEVDFIGTISEDMTNYSVILDSNDDDRTILVYKDASEKLDYKDIDREKLMARWFYFSAIDIKLLEKLSDYAVKKGIKVAFNPSNYLAEKGSERLKKVLKNTDLLILNNEEAELLVGKASILILLHRLQKLGPDIVVITQGSKGADVLYSDTVYQADALKVKVLETTGAGDAFGSSFLAGFILKNSIEYAIKLGIVNSASVVSKIGSKEGLLKAKEASDLIHKSKIKLKTVNLKK
jgi:ribokinase